MFENITGYQESVVGLQESIDYMLSPQKSPSKSLSILIDAIEYWLMVYAMLSHVYLRGANT